MDNTMILDEICRAVCRKVTQSDSKQLNVI
jgi:hypothetical protein